MRPFALWAAVSALFVACSVQSGNSATLRVRLEQRASSSGALDYVRTDGVAAQLQQLHVTISTVTLTPCGTTALNPRFRNIFKPFSEFIPVAHAHSASSAGTLGAPNVIALVGSPDTTLLGQLFPASDSCGVTLLFAPADADASGLPPGGIMLGQTSRAVYTLSGQSAVQPTDFSLRRSYPLLGGPARGADASIELRVDVSKVLAQGFEGDLSVAPNARWVAAVADALSASVRP